MSARTAWIAAALVALALVPVAGGRFAVDFATKTMIYAILALSLELLVGQVGLVCFGQAAFFGVAAYTVVLLQPFMGAASVWWLLPACLAATGLFAAAVGALSIRTRGVYFIMVTLAFSQMAYYVAHDTPLGGGTDGIYLPGSPQAVPFHYVTLGFLAAAFAFLAVLLRSRFGRALAGIRVNEQRMRAAGFPTYPYKLAAFVISALVAGVAGFLFAVKDGFVNPELLGWHVSGTVLMMVILGGVGRLHGAVVGAFAFALLQELFMSEAIFGSFAKHWHLGVGLSIILCVALMPRGLVGAWGVTRAKGFGNADERR